ncbi:MAG: DUF4386 domain-containing protein [Candidatus Heimdallarchaeota archaeon]|nr:DUF4386 domain-containing protein [Candidatus Heimdallarchaeota archaeon]
MNSNKMTARTVGVLFITATVAGILGVVLLDTILDDSDYLITVSENENQVLIGVLFELISAVAVAGTAITLFPIFKKHNETLALGYVGGRILEAVTIIVGLISALLLLTLSQEFVKAGAPDSHFQTLGTLFVATRDWTNLIGPNILLSLNALILSYLLYQLKLVPRFISVWGLIAAPAVLAAGLLIMFGLIGRFSTVAGLLVLPIALFEMVLAVWLIVKGFNSSAIVSESVKTDV